MHRTHCGVPVVDTEPVAEASAAPPFAPARRRPHRTARAYRAPAGGRLPRAPWFAKPVRAPASLTSKNTQAIPMVRQWKVDEVVRAMEERAKREAEILSTFRSSPTKKGTEKDSVPSKVPSVKVVLST